MRLRENERKWEENNTKEDKNEKIVRISKLESQWSATKDLSGKTDENWFHPYFSEDDEFLDIPMTIGLVRPGRRHSGRRAI